MKTTFTMLTIEQINGQLPSLEQKWTIRKNKHKNPKVIEKLFQKLNVILKRYRSGAPADGLQYIIDNRDANMYYLQLKHFISKNDFSYSDASLNVGTDQAIKTFMEYAENFTDKEYWKNLKDAYIIQNYKKISYKTLKELFASKRKYRSYLMNKEEIGFLKGLPNEITIYRGGSLTEEKSKKYGLSWTLNRTIAQNFASTKGIRNNKKMMVIEKRIKKSEIIAYFRERQEEEIIYLGN